MKKQKTAHASTGSARTVFEILTQLVRSTFALSSLRSGRIEGLYANQEPFLGLLYDTKAKQEGYICVFDESGEDYLYPESIFVPVEIPAKAREALGVVSRYLHSRN